MWLAASWVGRPASSCPQAFRPGPWRRPVFCTRCHVDHHDRPGLVRFRHVGGTDFRAPIHAGVPTLIELERLQQITERILRDEETDEDLQMIFAPGSPLGGARPKASLIDRDGRLSIAKFPKDSDDYSVETWEEVALRLARRAGIVTPHHQLVEVAGGGERGGRVLPKSPGWQAPSSTPNSNRRWRCDDGGRQQV